MSRRTQLSVVAIVAAILAGAAAVAWFVEYLHSRTPLPQPEHVEAGTFRPTKEQWSTLKIVAVAAQAFQTEQSTDGNIAYDDEATTPVFSPYSGRVTKVFAKLGDTVKPGDALMAVDASEFAQGQSDVATAHAQLTLAAQTEDRQHQLYLAKGSALKDWLQAQTDLAAAQNNWLAARNRLRILGKSDAEIDAIERGKAESRKSAETVIAAPIAGTITQRQVGVGQYITAGASTPVFSIGNLATVWVVANVREAQAAQVHVGLPVDVHVLAYPNRVVPAKLSWVASAVDPTTHRLPVRAEVENGDGSLKPMMFANVTIHDGDEATSPAVPKSAVVYEGEEARVYVVRKDGSVALTRVETGRSRGDVVEVTKGLAVGENIVSGGTLFIDRAVGAGS